MERHGLKEVACDDPDRLSERVEKALICGFFAQVAHKDEHGVYHTVKDNQVGFCLVRRSVVLIQACPA